MTAPWRTIVGAVIVLLGGCGDGGPSRGDVLAAYGRDVAIPAFEEFAAATDALVAQIDALCAGPTDATVSEVLDTVDEARSRWLATEAGWTGPAMERRSPAVTDWPVNGTEIVELIDESAPGGIDAGVIARRVGADNRGLSAVRWVLARDDAATLLTDSRWCDYLTASAEVMRTESELLVDDWTASWEDGPPFVEVLAAPDGTDGWLGMLVNDDLSLIHRLTERPDDEGDVPPIDVAADRATELAGVGDVAAALGPLLGDDLEARLLEEIDTAEAAFDAGDFAGGRVLAKEVERTWAADVAGRLGVTIGFSDADGDRAG